MVEGSANYNLPASSSIDMRSNSRETKISYGPIHNLPASASIDVRSGFCRETKIYYSLRPTVHLPCESLPLSVSSYIRCFVTSPLPTNAALIDAASGVSLSYHEFFSRSDILASNLRIRFPSLAKGQVAFILCPPSINIAVLYFALLSLRIVVCPSNPISSPSEIRRQIHLSKPSIFFATSSTVRSLPDCPSGTILLDSEHFEELMIRAPPASVIASAHFLHKFKQSDPAVILYSSGTTGKVKGVVLTHRNLIAMVSEHVPLVPAREAPVPGISLITVPLFHVLGFMVTLGALLTRKTIVLMERFDFGAMLRAVERYRVTSMPMSPPVMVALSKSDEVEKHDLRSLETVFSGGAPLGKKLVERFKSRFPSIEIIQGYGLTEVGTVATTIGSEESLILGSVGRLRDNMKAKVINPENGEALPPGQQGELCIQGPSIMQGYIGDEEATASAIDSEGWFKTGDLCYFDQGGNLFVVDRLKELIKYKAYQVPPAELEELLHSHPGIADVAVIPYPDEEVGQLPMAYVVRKGSNPLTEAQVMDFVAKQVAPYKKIRRVVFTNSIPKSAAGKILRRELVNHAMSNAKSKL